MSACFLLIIPSLAFGVIAGSLWQSWIYQRTLISKSHAKWRTPEKIGGSFYYIVPESEYVALLIARNRVEGQGA